MWHTREFDTFPLPRKCRRGEGEGLADDKAAYTDRRNRLVHSRGESARAPDSPGTFSHFPGVLHFVILFAVPTARFYSGAN